MKKSISLLLLTLTVVSSTSFASAGGGDIGGQTEPREVSPKMPTEKKVKAVGEIRVPGARKDKTK